MRKAQDSLVLRFFLLFTITDIPVSAGGAAPAAPPLAAVVVIQQDGDGDTDDRNGEQRDGESLHRLASFRWYRTAILSLLLLFPSYKITNQKKSKIHCHNLNRKYDCIGFPSPKVIKKIDKGYKWNGYENGVIQPMIKPFFACKFMIFCKQQVANRVFFHSILLINYTIG